MATRKAAAAKKTETPLWMTGPQPKFQMLGKSKYVHVLRTKAWDAKHSTCQQVRKYTIAGNVDYKKSLSAEAAMSLDGCEQCATLLVAERAIEPSDKAAARKEARDEVMERAKGKKTVKKAAPKVAKEKVVKEKAEPKAKAPKAERKPTPTKAGVRSVASRADGDPAQIKAQQLVDHAVASGWKASLSKDDDTGHWVVTATRDDETITAWYIDGKYDINRHAEVTVGSWVGKLRGAHACRRQMSAEGRDRPHPEPGKGRTGPRKSKEVEAQMDEDESNGEGEHGEQRHVPFLLDDDDLTIIDAIKGKTIYWRMGNGSRDEAWVPAEVGGGKRQKIVITTHPKTQRRMMSFLSVASVNEGGEVYGPERTVYLDKIVRVVG